jgi:hypothetical protein
LNKKPVLNDKNEFILNYRVKNMMKLLFITLLLITSYPSFAEEKLTFDEKIENADVIFIGNLKERFEKLDTVTLSNGETTENVYTTHVFNIDEVLKGHLEGKTVSVKLLGGCDREVKRCGKYNRFTYSFYGEPEETALLFLSFDELNNYYYSTQDRKTAFLVHGNIEIITDTDWVPIMAATNKANPKYDTITVDDLKKKIEAKDE